MISKGQMTVAIIAVLALVVIVVATSDFNDEADATTGNTWYIEHTNDNSIELGEGYGTPEDPLQVQLEGKNSGLWLEFWNKVQSGDTIYLMSSFQNIGLGKNVNIIGTNGITVGSMGIYNYNDTFEDGLGSMSFDNVKFTGKIVLGSSSSTPLSSYSFNRCTFDYTTATTIDRSVDIRCVYDVSFTNCVFDGAVGKGYWNTAMQVFEGGNSLAMTDCTFKNYLRGLDLQMFKNINVSKCTFDIIQSIDTTSAIAIQIKEDMTGANISISDNILNSDAPTGVFLSVHENGNYNGVAPIVTVTGNSVVGFPTGILYKASSNGEICAIHINANRNYYSIDGSQGEMMTIVNKSSTMSIDGLVDNSEFYLNESMTELNTDTAPGYEEDDDFPPFIPQQTTEDDDTTLYIACCAAAAVVALLAIIIVMNERKR